MEELSDHAGAVAAREQAQEAEGEEGRGTGHNVAFGRNVPVLAVVSPASVSAREGSLVMSRGWWCGTVVVDELWLEHAPNRGTGVTQNASNTC